MISAYGFSSITVKGNETHYIQGTNHAVWGYVTNVAGNPVQDGTNVNIAVYHINHYKTYISSGTVSGWYSYTLNGSDQGTNWDIGDNIWVNVTYQSQLYLNQTTILAGTNQRIDVHCVTPIPEFSAFVIPAIVLITIFVVVTKRKRKADERPRTP